MKNRIKFIIAVAILSILFNIVAILYYLLQIRPEFQRQENALNQFQSAKSNQDEIFTKTLTCQSEGDRYVKNDANSSQSNFIQLTHHTVYSQKYNACILLYPSQLKYDTETATFNQIVNLNTRQDVYYYSYTRLNQKPYTKKVTLGDSDEYKRIVLEVFGIEE